MMDLHIDQQAGLVRVGGEWFLVMGYVADFILDYPAYDPNYDPSRRPTPFRNGLMTVTPQDGHAYMEALAHRSLPLDQVGALLNEYGPDRTRPIILIDFDNALFVSAFFDQALEDEVGAGWTGSYADPMQHAPPELQAIWPPFPE